MKNIKKKIKKVITKETIFYVVFGIFTSIINLGVFFVLNYVFNYNENISNFIAILLAVLFAYVTNKDLVFHSKAEGIKEKWLEFVKFMTGRAFTMLVEFIGGLILFNLQIPHIITKIGLTIIVVILNFFISKFLIFKNKKSN